MTTACGQCRQTIAATLHYCPFCGFDQDSAVPGEQAPATEHKQVVPPAAEPPSASPPSASPPAASAQRRCVTPDCGMPIPTGVRECLYCGAAAGDEGTPAASATTPIARLALPGGDSIAVSADGARLGRDPEFCDHADRLAAYLNVSRRHALITVAGGRLTVSDLGSTNGTFLNGMRLTAYIAYPLNDGDELRMGATCVLRLLLGPATPGAAGGSQPCA